MVVNCNWIRVGKEGRGADLAVVAVIAFILVHVLLFIVYRAVITVQRFCGGTMNDAKSTKTLEPTSSVVAMVPPGTVQRRRQAYFIFTALAALFTLSIIIGWIELFRMPQAIDAKAGAGQSSFKSNSTTTTSLWIK